MLFFLLINYVICHEWPHLPAISYYNIAFLLEVQIHNSQLYLIIDTGSSVTMIEKHYQNSETFQSLNSIYEQQYDLGKCNGVFGVDQLILSKQVQIPQFTMAYGTCQQMPFFDENIGLMGMSNRHQVKHVFEDGQFSSSIFGLEFRRVGESRLYYNISTVQKVTWHKLSVDHRWMVNMLGVYANDEDVSDIFTGQAFIDSGYSCLILSHTQFTYLWDKYFKERCKLIDSQIYCDCQYSEFPNLTIYFEGAKITINSENYFPYSYNGKLCKLCLSKHKKDYLILGLPFVMSTTVLFDKRNQQIGLVDSPEIYQLSPWYFNIGLFCGGLIALWILFYSLQKDKTFIRIEIEMKNLEIL